jgi:Tol biopolymer transport system component
MELQPGQVLSHFRVVEKFDEGGMGVVYRAHDLHLERDVAIKILSNRSGSSPSENRFRREALALSRLNHPNIASVFDFDVHEDIRFLVMEWIAGITLSTKLAAGPLAEREILDFGEQMASALGYAHAEGVIHRDLKPSNLRITPEDRVKILDFGLAKLTPISDSAATETRPDARAVAGTLPYIAPEVLNGRPASPASDVYGLAAVLYEMATGRRAFPHEDSASLTVAILNEAPCPPRQLNPAVSRELEHVILRGLEKKPELRYATASEMRADLRRITSGLPLMPRARGRKVPQYVRWIAAAAVVSAMVMAPGVGGRRQPPPSPVMKPIVSWPGIEGGARISPDGHWILFLSDRGGKSGLWLQRVKGGEPRLLTADEGLTDAMWSPDGESIAALMSTLGAVSLRILPAFGGRVAVALSLPAEMSNALLLRWYERNIYLEIPGSGLWKADSITGRANRLVEAEGPEGMREQFDVHSDENRFAFSVRNAGHLTMWVGDLGTKRVEPVTDGPSNESGARFGSGQVLFFTSDRSNQIDLWRLDLDSRERRQLTFSSSLERVQSVSDDLSLLTFVEEQDESHLWVYQRSTDKHHQLTAHRLRDDWPSAARNGSLAIQRQKPVVQKPLRVLDAEIFVSSLHFSMGDSWIRLGDGGMPSFSPDGSRLAYARPGRRPHHQLLHVRDIATGADRVVSEGFRVPKNYRWPRDFDRSSITWTDDGALLFIARSEQDRDEVRRWNGVDPPVLIHSALKGTIIREIAADRDRVALVVESSPAPGPVEVLILENGTHKVVSSMQRDFRQTMYMRGPLPDRTWVILRSTLNPDYSERASIHIVDARGRSHDVGTVDRAFAGTATLDAAGGVVYFTAFDERGIHNIVAISLTDGVSRTVTNNGVPGISFAGFEVTAAGDLLYVLQKNSQDVWLIDFQPDQRKETR